MWMRGDEARRGVPVVVWAGLLVAALTVAGGVIAPPHALAADVELPLYAHWANSDVEYLDAGGDAKELKGADYTMLSEAIANSYTLASGWYVVDAVGFTADQRIVVDGDVRLVLRDGQTLDASRGGIQVASGSSLTVYQQSVGAGATAGALVATATESGDAGIGGSAGKAACGTVAIYGGTVSATGAGGGAGIGGGSGADGSGGTVAIGGGKVTATAGGAGAAGIGAGASAGADALASTAVRLDWTRTLFSATEVSATSYSGTVEFVRPYVLKSSAGAAVPEPARFDSASSQNVNGAAIVPGIHFRDGAGDVPLKEGRWYARFTGGGAEVDVPANSAFTALVDAAGIGRAARDAYCSVTGITLKFGSALPQGTVVVLTVIGQGDGGEACRHYSRTVGAAGVTEVELSGFDPMGDATGSFAPHLDGAGAGDDVAYLVSVDFGSASASATGGRSAVDVQASYSCSSGDWGTARSGACVVSGGEDEFGLVALGALEAGASGGQAEVKVVRQPSGSELLSGRKVHLVGAVSRTAGGGDAVSLQGSVAICGDMSGTWIAPDVVAFELGNYGDLGSLVGSPLAFSVASADPAAAGEYSVAWTLCTGPALSGGPAGWNIRRDVVSEAISPVAFTVGSAGEPPRLSASPRTVGSRLLAAEDSHEPHDVVFGVAANRSYRVSVERQTALHSFAAVLGSVADYGSDIGEVHVSVPGDPGVYRVRFSIDEASAADDVFYTFVVARE